MFAGVGKIQYFLSDSQAHSPFKDGIPCKTMESYWLQLWLSLTPVIF